jgi:hypothetical protein
VRVGKWNVQIALAAAFLLAAVAGANAVNFSLRDQNTIFALGPIGDAAKFAALTRFSTLELDNLAALLAKRLLWLPIWMHAVESGPC